MLKLRTAYGDDLTATPDHPVLTACGWVLMDQVERGDYLVCARRDVVAASAVPVGPHVEHREPTVQQVYDALALAALDGQGRGPRTVHLDGQGSAGEHVDVHVIDDVLAFGRYPAALEFLGKFAVPITELEMSGPGDVGAHASATQTDRVRFAAGPHGQPDVAEAAHDLGARRTELLRHGQDSHALAVQSGDVGVQGGPAQCAADLVADGAGPDRHPGVPQAQIHGADAVPDFARHLGERLAGFVSFAQVIDVDGERFRGHVYDLTTKDHAYTVGRGYIVHNCTTLFLDEDELTPEQRDEIDQADPQDPPTVEVDDDAGVESIDTAEEIAEEVAEADPLSAAPQGPAAPADETLPRIVLRVTTAGSLGAPVACIGWASPQNPE
nr:hypothetical protein [Microbispora rosea]